MKRSKILLPSDKAEDWKTFLAEPEKQWKKGYSARTLAHCWNDANGIPDEMAKVLSQEPVFENLETLLVIPEHQVPLPGGTRPSQNDCWVLAKTQVGDLVSIAVEGKVSEPFGPTLGEWFKNASDGKRKRLAFLQEQLGLTGSIPDSIRYQLLHHTASAVIEAKRFNAKYAVIVVYSFSETVEWFDDYFNFAKLYNVYPAKGEICLVVTIYNIHLHLAWGIGNAYYLNR